LSVKHPARRLEWMKTHGGLMTATIPFWQCVKAV